MTANETLLKAIFTPKPTVSEYPINETFQAFIDQWKLNHPKIKTVVLVDEYGNHNVSLTLNDYNVRNVGISVYESQNVWETQLNNELKWL